MPCIDCRISFDQRGRHRRGLEEPEAMSQGEVGNRRLAKQVVTLLALQLLLQTRHDRRPLMLRLFGRQFCRATTTEQTGTVGQKRLDRFRRQIAKAHRYRFWLEHQAHRMLEHHRISPGGKRRSDHFLTFREERRQGLFLLQSPGNQCRVAINICTDLQHRCLAVATGQRREIRFWHHWRDLHRAPGQALEAQQQASLFGKGGRRVMMQNQLGHARLRRKDQESAA
ncbi:hypothetical protein D3C86_1414800 [compost metagenome]